MYKYLLAILSIFTIACSSSKKNEYTYFGGKIINPKGKYVIISNSNEVIDSIVLNENNTFLGKLKGIKSGLYYFQHGTEYQYIYLEPNDSLLIRLNTWDFDESIVFSGKQANRNNMLIETFLQNEKDEEAFYKLYKLNYTEFKKKIDSLEAEKKALFEYYKTKNNETSKDFLNILKIAVLYPVYRKIENYSIYNLEQGTPQKLSNQTMYSYREHTPLNFDDLFFFTPYNDMAISQIYNDTYLEGHKNFTDDFNTSLLKNIDRKIKSEKIKNKILKQTTIGVFYRNTNYKTQKKTLKSFFNLCTDTLITNRVKRLIKDIETINKNDKIPDFEITEHNSNVLNIAKQIANKNSVIYFKNTNHSSDEWIASRINYFIKKYPNIDYYVIDINQENTNYISNLNTKRQFYLNKTSDAHKFLTSKYSRIFLVNKNGIIKNDFSGISSNKIEAQIADLQKD